MRINEILLEYNRNKSINTYGNKLYSRLETEAENNNFAEELFDKVDTSFEIVEWIEQQDPTQDKNILIG